MYHQINVIVIRVVVVVMKSEKEVVDMIIEIEALFDPENEYSYLDEGQQAELQALYSVLDRDLTKKENSKVEKLRKVYLGE